MKIRKRNTVVSAAVAAVIGASAPAHVAFSQQGDGFAVEEIIVTARKREESLLDVPVAITAFGRDDIVAANIQGLDDVSSLTAGFQFFNQGNQQPGRYNTQLQFRGLTTAQFSPSFATGALFIDGIYVLNGGTSVSLMDIERIEVIKGPQAAYFGRNTFGGAVNLITRDPSMEEFSGEVGLTATGRRNNEITAFIEGPLIRDRLSFSASGRFYDKRGHYVATDGGRMGNEETRSFNGVLLWQPTDALSLKLRYANSRDDDGTPAQGFISGIINDNCTGRVIQSPEGPALPQRYICGQVPDINTARTFSGGPVINSNTFLPQQVIDAGLTAVPTLAGKIPGISDVGLRRDIERLSLAIDYDIGEYTLSGVLARNEQGANWIRDFDLSDRLGWFSRDPQYMKDESYELRLTAPQDGRFRWLAGVNYYTQEFTSSGSGGDATTSCFSPSPTFTDDPATCLPITLLFPNALGEADKADVTGIFGSVEYDLTDQITLSAEARYQRDKLTKGAGVLNPGAPVLEETFSDILPRLIVRYQPTDSTNLFVSYSEGLIAGDFNSFVINADERELEQYLEQDPRVSTALDAETLKAWEFGWKQTLLDGRAQFGLSLYRNTWRNIKGRSSFAINETCRPADIASSAPGCDPGLGQAVGDPKLVDDGSGNLVPFFNARNTLLPGNATIKGVEIETVLRASENFTVAASLTYIDSSYDDYPFNFVAPIAGFEQMRGNQTPRQPKWAGNLTMTKDFTVMGLDAFFRTDFQYQGRSFVDESNLAYISDYVIVNLRAGVETDRYRVELFVRNLLDEDAWATGARWTDFSSPFQAAFFTAKQGVAVSPQDRRDFGIRANIRF